jgi:TatD DNase family protein
MDPKYFDIHSHLNFSAFNEDREEVIKKMRDEKVWTICVGTDLITSKEVVELAEKHDEIFATVGLHPNDNKELFFIEGDYKELVKNKKIVAVGECGLDYFRIGGDAVPAGRQESDKKRQKENFERQIQFALAHDLPLMNHFRPSAHTMDAYHESFDILNSYFKTYGSKLRGNSHFFAGDLEVAKKFLNTGFTLSFAGHITFTDSYNEVVKYSPLDMIHAETDSPFAAPVPHRGKRNEPLYVKEIVKRISEIKNKDLDTVKSTLVENALKTFDIAYTV